MSLFYKEEHTTCYNYRTPSVANFAVLRYAAGEDFVPVSVNRSVIVFLMEGEIQVNSGLDNEFVHKAGTLVLHPRNSGFSFKVLKDCLILSCAYSQCLNLCNRYAFEKLIGYLPDDFQYKFQILPIKKRMKEFCTLLIHCLDDGLQCSHYHESKENELFLLLRTYYSKEELAMFFYPLLVTDLDFRDFIMDNYTLNTRAASLAEKLNLTLKTFNRRFENTFGTSFHQWVIQQKVEWISRDLTLTEKPIAEIALDYDFSSASYLTSFCKKNIGKTPLQIRKENGKLDNQ
ncbi:helix-turn-helix domain-containing protein [Parabacteroides johnsonii]|uniref:helix-turn-helix domain-containing protein n=1 Tax=Parabacteroides johnsonii TaxID=387661 RepID=UPI0011DC7D22|nr:AraC family transcriptional regulator [Parabacteroides johnsonii]